MADLMLFPGLGRRWWMLLIRGVAAILFGIAAFTWPGLTLVVLTTIFGVYAFIDGVLALMVGLHARWWILAAVGLVGILIGIVAFVNPGLTALTLLLMIAVWAILRGAIELIAAVQLRKVIANEWALIVAGLCSLAFGILLFARPAAGALAVIWIIGAYALVIGLSLVVLALRVRSHHHAVAIP